MSNNFCHHCETFTHGWMFNTPHANFDVCSGCYDTLRDMEQVNTPRHYADIATLAEVKTMEEMGGEEAVAEKLRERATEAMARVAVYIHHPAELDAMLCECQRETEAFWEGENRNPLGWA
jgi:hypothetical protein